MYIFKLIKKILHTVVQTSTLRLVNSRKVQGKKAKIKNSLKISNNDKFILLHLTRTNFH